MPDNNLTNGPDGASINRPELWKETGTRLKEEIGRRHVQTVKRRKQKRCEGIKARSQGAKDA